MRRPSAPSEGVWAWARERVHDAVGAGDPVGLDVSTPWRTAVRFTWLLYRRMRADQAFLRAAGMAYATLVALVPLLLLLFGAFEATGVMQRNPEAVEALVFGSFLGDIPEVRSFLLPGLLGVDLGTMGLIGIGGLAFVAGRLYIQIEEAYCDIFGVDVDRPLYWRLLMFYVSVTLAPVLGIAMFLQSWELAGWLGLGGTTQVTAAVVQLGLLLAAMMGFPTTKVRLGPALGGSLVSLALLQACSAGFREYLVLFAADDPVRVIYGSVGVLPVFLLWLYLAWLSVLIGVEVAAVAQGYRSLFEAEVAEAFEQHAAGSVPGVDTVLLVAARAAAWFAEGRGVMERDALAEAVGLRGADVSMVLRALEGGGLVARVEDGWLLTRAPEQIRLADIVAAWRRRTSPHPDAEGPAAAVRADLDRALEGSLADAARRWVVA